MNSHETSISSISHGALKQKQRSIREGFPAPIALRVHRALSWLGRAERENEDPDLRFILLWVSFNSAYAKDVGAEGGSEREVFKSYFDMLVSLDTAHRIYEAVWNRFPHEIRILLINKYVFAPFWSHQNGIDGYADWEERLATSQRVIGSAMAQRDTAKILSVVFDRLYVLRNQLLHGGATWNSGVNRQQVRDGAAVLDCMLPVFIDLMMDNPLRDWGRPFYPVVD